MTRDAIIQKTLHALNVLPHDKAMEVSDFVDFILKKYEDQTIQKGIQIFISNSETFSFLNDEENLYSPSDIKEKF